MDNSDHRSKRRRLESVSTQNISTPETKHVYSPIDSSSDELAALSDHDEQRRRVSWTAQKVYPPKRPYRRSRSFSGSESPDELAVDADVYWRSRNRGRSPSHSETSAQERLSERYQDDELEADEEESAGDVEVDQEYSDRSPTPVPPPAPPPPPKPEKLTYQQKFLLRGHLRGVSAVKFSPDSTMIATGGADGAVKVWDTRSGKLIHTFEGHLAGISTISWSPDGATIASGSDDKTIRLWNVLTVVPCVYVCGLTKLMSFFH
jgi:COMPASS component SWD3